ncbi:hypothetical protein WN943_011276 [Citrus x changshan-huyou]
MLHFIVDGKQEKKRSVVETLRYIDGNNYSNESYEKTAPNPNTFLSDQAMIDTIIQMYQPQGILCTARFSFI